MGWQNLHLFKSYSNNFHVSTHVSIFSNPYIYIYLLYKTPSYSGFHKATVWWWCPGTVQALWLVDTVHEGYIPKIEGEIIIKMRILGGNRKLQKRRGGRCWFCFSFFMTDVVSFSSTFCPLLGLNSSGSSVL